MQMEFTTQPNHHHHHVRTTDRVHHDEDWPLAYYPNYDDDDDEREKEQVECSCVYHHHLEALWILTVIIILHSNLCIQVTSSKSQRFLKDLYSFLSQLAIWMDASMTNWHFFIKVKLPTTSMSNLHLPRQPSSPSALAIHLKFNKSCCRQQVAFLKQPHSTQYSTNRLKTYTVASNGNYYNNTCAFNSFVGHEKRRKDFRGCKTFLRIRFPHGRRLVFFFSVIKKTNGNSLNNNCPSDLQTNKLTWKLVRNQKVVSPKVSIIPNDGLKQ